MVTQYKATYIDDWEQTECESAMAAVASQTNAAKRQTQPRTDKSNPKACHEAMTRFAKDTWPRGMHKVKIHPTRNILSTQSTTQDQQDSSSQAVRQNEQDSNVTPVESLQSIPNIQTDEINPSQAISGQASRDRESRPGESQAKGPPRARGRLRGSGRQRGSGQQRAGGPPRGHRGMIWRR